MAITSERLLEEIGEEWLYQTTAEDVGKISNYDLSDFDGLDFEKIAAIVRTFKLNKLSQDQITYQLTKLHEIQTKSGIRIAETREMLKIKTLDEIQKELSKEVDLNNNNAKLRPSNERLFYTAGETLVKNTIVGNKLSLGEFKSVLIVRERKAILIDENSGELAHMWVPEGETPLPGLYIIRSEEYGSASRRDFVNKNMMLTSEFDGIDRSGKRKLKVTGKATNDPQLDIFREEFETIVPKKPALDYTSVNVNDVEIGAGYTQNSTQFERDVKEDQFDMVSFVLIINNSYCPFTGPYFTVSHRKRGGLEFPAEKAENDDEDINNIFERCIDEELNLHMCDLELVNYWTLHNRTKKVSQERNGFIVHVMHARLRKINHSMKWTDGEVIETKWAEHYELNDWCLRLLRDSARLFLSDTIASFTRNGIYGNVMVRAGPINKLRIIEIKDKWSPIKIANTHQAKRLVRSLDNGSGTTKKYLYTITGYDVNSCERFKIKDVFGDSDAYGVFKNGLGENVNKTPLEEIFSKLRVIESEESDAHPIIGINSRHKQLEHGRLIKFEPEGPSGKKYLEIRWMEPGSRANYEIGFD